MLRSTVVHIFVSAPLIALRTAAFDMSTPNCRCRWLASTREDEREITTPLRLAEESEAFDRLDELLATRLSRRSGLVATTPRPTVEAVARTAIGPAMK